MARFSAAPKQENMKRMLRVFGYLKNHSKHSIIVDTRERIIPTSADVTVNWQEQYPGVAEELPPNMPTPKGKTVQITTYVDTDHAHDQVTRRSVTGILLFVNNTPIKWYSKRQNTVETSTYGAESVALRIAIELIIEFRCKLIMMGIPIKGASQVLCDIKSVVLSTSLPSSALKKKHNALAYHWVREAVAAGIVKVSHIAGTENVVDILTKPTDGPTSRKHLKSILVAL